MHACEVIVETKPVPEAPRVPSLFQCPSCGASLGGGGGAGAEEDVDAAAPATEALPQACGACGARFPRRTGYVDLTATSGSMNVSSSQSLSPFALSSGLASTVGAPLRQAIFQLPPVAYAYERGWRDNFRRAGFPGPAMEADLALDFVQVERGGVLLDVSCGTGVLTRRLAGGTEARVVAADISQAMLADAVRRARADVRTPDIDFVRADVANLPFAPASLDAVHAGAAIHCWPRLQDSLREIRRVLKPGGRFFATTFFIGAYWPRRLGGGSVPLESFVDRLQRRSLLPTPYRFFSQDELTFLLRAAGFASVDVERRGGCAIVRCVERDDKDKY